LSHTTTRDAIINCGSATIPKTDDVGKSRVQHTVYWMALPKTNSPTPRILWADTEPQPPRLFTNKVKPLGSSNSLRAHLPISKTTEYAEGQKIYGEEDPSKSIYLVVTGMVEISQTAKGARGVLLEIIRPDELFGESAFLTSYYPSEQATALHNTTLMTWAVSDVQDLILRRPELAAVLLQFFAQRKAEIRRRIVSLSLDTIERRLARSLLRFSERLGTPEADGYVRITLLTHEMLSRSVGASNEIIAQCMKRFRKQGYVSYSCRDIVLSQDPFQELLSKTVKRLGLRKRAPL
jgi:CRP/FNR family transcriptional regulator, cyclic AMP receptor protein